MAPATGPSPSLKPSRICRFPSARIGSMRAAVTAYRLYHALIAAGHASWCTARDGRDDPCRCGRTAALKAYEAERDPARPPGLSLVPGEGRR